MRYLIAVLLVLLPLAAWALEPVGELELVEYVRTIDGDTIVVERDGVEEHVRLFAIDAPELKEGTPAAFLAALTLSRRLAGADAVYLETDPVALTDSFDRTLAWVWWESGGALRLMNAKLVGFSYVEYYEDTQSDRYRDVMQGVEPEGHADLYTGGADYSSDEEIGTPPAERTALELTDLGMRWINHTSAYAYCSWQADVKVNRKMFVNLHIMLYDKDGFMLDESYMWKQLAQVGDNHFSDKFLVRTDLAKLVDNYYVEVKEAVY